MRIGRILILAALLQLEFLCPRPAYETVNLTKIRPLPGERWCQYKIVGTIGCGGVKFDGQTLCILCSSKFAANKACPMRDVLKANIAPNCDFELKPLDIGQQVCENCTTETGETYQVR